ncbi:hypothetical protein [Roseivirga seohaensis]|uniref:hypothetical protein n=1 Tax=Roseivirga seohaensis TaxID=1914963 RepID=UPI003BADB760
MKKKLLFTVLGLSAIFVMSARQETRICPGSGITCEAKVTQADGSSVEVKSQKDKDSDAVIIKKQ